MLVVCFVTPLVLFMLVPVSFLYIKVQRYYIGASRELKRLDSLAMSPIFSNFVETLQGLPVIRAFGLESRFDTKNQNLLTQSNRAYWPMVSSNRWLSVRLEYLGTTVTFSCALVSAVFASQSAGMSGLAITSAMNMTGLMTWMVRQMTELEVNMNSIERLTEYDDYESEGDSTKHLLEKVSRKWPRKGKIVLNDVFVKYRPDLPYVLRGLNLTINQGEKVGVCGRTGCGKSTMMMTLYRMVELDQGKITIDDVNIASVTLNNLRSKLSLVPQDPVIFSGTVRSNLDPFNETKDDGEIWSALKLSGMKATIEELPDKKGLDSSIDEGGGNLSVGQTQLLCMARALIRKSKILILDEATSNVDGETDNLIQKTIRVAFKDCTVLTIAHRLNTIIDSDKILLLHEGQVAEYDSPEVLLANTQSRFFQLVEKSKENSSNMRVSKSSNSLNSVE
jgi:ABC-type multidrug transport system fused ATPase/permease subunit